MSGAALGSELRSAVERAAATRPEHPAFVCGDVVVRYAEFRQRVAALRGQSMAAFVVEPTVADIARLWACVRDGGAVAPIHAKATAAERLRNLLVVDTALPAEEDIAAVFFTSGSTGAPKGVMLSARAFCASARASAGRLGWEPSDRWLLTITPAHIGGFSILTRCALAAATVVLPRLPRSALSTSARSAPGRFDPGAVLRSIDADRVTIVSLVPTMLNQLIAHDPDWRPPAHLRAVLIGGASASPSLIEAARSRRWPLRLTYGLTEACSQVTLQEEGGADEQPAGDSSGAALDGMQLRVVDGGIQIRGPALFSGYLCEAPEAPTVHDERSWFDTGDLGRLDSEGRVYVQGRGTELIVTGGENVLPREVELALEACAGVVEACVFGVPDRRWGEVVAAAVTTDETFNREVARDRLRACIANYKRPRQLWITDTLARTPNGKIDRAGIRLRATEHLRPF